MTKWIRTLLIALATCCGLAIPAVTALPASGATHIMAVTGVYIWETNGNYQAGDSCTNAGCVVKEKTPAQEVWFQDLHSTWNFNGLHLEQYQIHTYGVANCWAALSTDEIALESCGSLGTTFYMDGLGGGSYRLGNSRFSGNGEDVMSGQNVANNPFILRVPGTPGLYQALFTAG